jgi:DNA polymerase-3 subunit gamma/tau
MAKQQARFLADEPDASPTGETPNVATQSAAELSQHSKPAGAGHEYVVVARRYRPQAFDELVGQEHVAKALTNAIAANRVGHAYLFTGARGVGKTSAARILAKALQCVEGPTSTPCNHCDICQSIAAGSDVDVLEIDGASNRGIDEIRQLRQNVGVRPSRARFKIYIIDEVHMLTREAFNALLKTLEEPPEHVKFIFCTTEANKIPITILSRCQRFDFAGIRAPSIRERLAQIAAAEGVEAEPAALDLLARRANGSMRDSQSLLEQLLSFGGQKITASDVNSLLGTAGEARLATMLKRLIEHDARGALEDLDVAVFEGVEVGQLLEQLLGVFRDAMAAAVGCAADSFLYTSNDGRQLVADAGKTLGLNTILAVMQIIDHTLARMRYSTQGRTLAETALVRICSLENLDAIAAILERLDDGAGDATQERSPAPRAPNATAATAPIRSAAPSDVRRDDVEDASGKKKAELATERVDAAKPSEGLTPSVADGRREPALRNGPTRPSPADAAARIQAANAAFDSLGGAIEEPAELFKSGELAEAVGGESPQAARGVEIASAEHKAPPDNLAGSGESEDWQAAAREPEQFWGEVINRLDGIIFQDYARCASRVAISAPNRLAVFFTQRYNFQKSFCEKPERLAELVRVCEQLTGLRPRIDFVVDADAVTKSEPATRATPPAALARQRIVEKSAHPLVECVAQTFGGVVVRVDPPAE